MSTQLFDLTGKTARYVRVINDTDGLCNDVILAAVGARLDSMNRHLPWFFWV